MDLNLVEIFYLTNDHEVLYEINFAKNLTESSFEISCKKITTKERVNVLLYKQSMTN